jgi:hypothetical protein
LAINMAQQRPEKNAAANVLAGRNWREQKLAR